MYTSVNSLISDLGSPGGISTGPHDYLLKAHANTPDRKVNTFFIDLFCSVQGKVHPLSVKFEKSFFENRCTATRQDQTVELSQ